MLDASAARVDPPGEEQTHMWTVRLWDSPCLSPMKSSTK